MLLRCPSVWPKVIGLPHPTLKIVAVHPVGQPTPQPFGNCDKPSHCYHQMCALAPLGSYKRRQGDRRTAVLFAGNKIVGNLRVLSSASVGENFRAFHNPQQRYWVSDYIPNSLGWRSTHWEGQGMGSPS